MTGMRSTSRRGGVNPVPYAVIGLAAIAAASLRALAASPSRRGDPAVPAPDPRLRPDDGRGRAADRPTAIPAAGWRDIAVRVWHEVDADRVLAVAGGVTFYALLSLAPFMTAFVSLYGLVAEPSGVAASLADLRGLLPDSALAILGDQMARLAAKPGEALGAGFLAGLAVALWSANAGMKALIDALNVAYEETESRGFVRFTLVSFAFTLGAMALLAAAAGAVVVLPIVLGLVGLGGSAELALRLLRWPLLLAVVAIGLAVLYRYGPSRRRARWRWITPGSAFATIGFLAVSLAFSWYASGVGDYDGTYGSLGAVIAFMTWMWISAIVVLVGAEINAEIEHQTARDSTRGPDRPLGLRGARMADTIGKPAG